jgi:glutathione S-transferase
VEEDLVNRSQKIKDLNPLAKVPTIITANGKVFFESFVVMQYFIQRSGRTELLPEEWRYEMLSFCEIVQQIPTSMFMVGQKQSPGRLRKLRAWLTKLNDYYLADGKHFMHQVIGQDTLTMHDIALFPFIELLQALKNRGPMGVAL